jgi:lipopolysaccharide export system protein LptA
MLFLRRPLHIAFIALLLPIIAMAQTTGTQITFGDKKQDPATPVHVTADKLVVNQTDRTALFTGHVIVIQGQFEMTAPSVQMIYTKETATTKSTISRIHATEGVTLTDGAETAKGMDAVYTVIDGQVVMIGNVLMIQGQNAMAGRQLNIDLNTNTGVMVGRVSAAFHPQSSGQKP